MCGINGIVRLKNRAAPIERNELIRVRDHMTNRGPDGAGEWFSSNGEIGLGHRRLAIIDLSALAHQPMSWANKRYWIVFNGEIYNYRELRTELQTHGAEFRSNSDTEVLLALYERYGATMLTKLRGMYALAIWDSSEHSLFLARDPYGIKPLYYSVDSNYFKFASQVKALQCSLNISTKISPAGLVSFLLWGAVSEPFSIYETIKSLPAGHYIFVKEGTISAPVAFYEFDQFRAAACSSADSALSDTVKAHLVSDVPVALFLSSGLDSALLAALMCRHQRSPVTTFTIRFDEFTGTDMDEGPLAKQIARTLGTNHIERTITRDLFRELWPQAVAAMDQPSIDGLNTFVISRIAREAGLKVVLSGLGGDELMGSYPSFRQVPSLARMVSILNKVPGSEKAWRLLAQLLFANCPKTREIVRYGNTLVGAYFLRRALFLPEELPNMIEPQVAAEGLAQLEPFGTLQRLVEQENQDPWLAIHLLESQHYMRNQLLRDSDWASMANSLELRVPLVDVRLREQLTALNFDPARSFGKATTVRQSAPNLPSQIWNRPKTGFSFPAIALLHGEKRSGDPRHGWGVTSRRLALQVMREFNLDFRFSPESQDEN